MLFSYLSKIEFIEPINKQHSIKIYGQTPSTNSPPNTPSQNPNSNSNTQAPTRVFYIGNSYTFEEQQAPLF